MKTPKILFLKGGWDGHKPEQIVHRFHSALVGCGWQTETITILERLADTDWLQTFDVISPCWTCGKLSKEESDGRRLQMVHRRAGHLSRRSLRVHQAQLRLSQGLVRVKP